MRVHIPLTVTSLDRLRPFAEKCEVIIASASSKTASALAFLQRGIKNPLPIFTREGFPSTLAPASTSVVGRGRSK